MKTPVVVFPTGFYNNEIKIVEMQIKDFIYDDNYIYNKSIDNSIDNNIDNSIDNNINQYEKIYKNYENDFLYNPNIINNKTNVYNYNNLYDYNFIPSNIKFNFLNEINIIPTNLSVGNDEFLYRTQLPSFTSLSNRIKIAKEYNKTYMYKKYYKIQNDNFLLYKINRNITESKEIGSISVNNFYKIKEIKLDNNNINQSIVYSRNDFGLFIFLIQYTENDFFSNMYEDSISNPKDKKDRIENYKLNKTNRTYYPSNGYSNGYSNVYSNDYSIDHQNEQNYFKILNYKIQITKDILLFDRLYQICPSPFTFGKCLFIGNHNSLYSYDVQTNVIEISDVNNNSSFFKQNDTFICMCHLQDDNTILFGARNLYIYDRRENQMAKFNTSNYFAKKTTKKRTTKNVSEQFGNILTERNINSNNLYNENMSRSHFNHGYTALQKNPDFPFIIAAVNASFNVIELWDTRNQYEPLFIFPLNISEFTYTYFRHIEWIRISPNVYDYDKKNCYNLAAFSYYEHQVYIRKIVIYDDFTNYKDLGIQTYTNKHSQFMYNYLFKNHNKHSEVDFYDAIKDTSGIQDKGETKEYKRI